MTNQSNQSDVELMTEQELAEYLEANKSDDTLWEAKGRKLPRRRGHSTVFQMRIAPEELEEIALAAGDNISEFVRSAALEKARASRSEQARTVQELRRQVKQLEETVSRL